MTDPIMARLDAIKGRADKATEGPWEWDDFGEVSQHWSRPKPWGIVVSTEVVCMAYCYGGTGRGIEREEDGEFIAAARTDVPQMEQALRAVMARCEKAISFPIPDGEMRQVCIAMRETAQIIRDEIASALGVEIEGELL